MDPDEDDDDEDNALILERLVAQLDQDLPHLDLDESFTVLQELGSGSYGSVLLTQPRDGGSPLVLKLLRKERTERSAFLWELCIAQGVSGHSSCLRALPVAFETSTHFGFGLELAPNGDLCELLRPGQGLPEPQIKLCASQLSSALDFLHGRALVHADVKLDNVLLFDPHCQRIKLGDFGLTRVQGFPMGPMQTPLPYAPPELCSLQGSQTLPLDPSLDVWAFGVLLFCLCTGCFPWAVAMETDAGYQEFSAWQRGQRAAVPAAWGDIGAVGLGMLRRLLSLDPDRRSPAMEVNQYLELPWGALEFLHGRALVHADVKLDNVLLFDPHCQRIKLGDFGLNPGPGLSLWAPLQTPLP
ncbi:uncharacterized serine/threonine-protein kinase SBK3-like [Melopsittacus undulatus]|uniref:uncharacterized serine/threonine-protein kinase SBK3-like n=1 Tax=Melopsittacus undulatus TaxID=13146 RepID=UPI00146B5FEA|nr:uncharacterized serine/threonine-protein kinase SBK3-like [Melopsittacus undulatus]